MRFLQIISTTLFLTGYLNASEDIIDQYAGKTIAWTMPKCGTNLLVVLLDRIFENRLEGIAPGQGSRNPGRPKFYLGHFYSFYDFLNSDVYFEKIYRKEKILLLIRDLRDRVLSCVDYMDQRNILLWPNILYSLQEDLEKLHMDLYGTRGNFHFSNYKQLSNTEKEVLKMFWHGLAREEKINRTIVALAYFSDQDLSVFETLHTAIAHEFLYLVKYENILPPEGGNDPDRLINEVCKIAQFLGVDIPFEKYESIILGLWGNPKSWTFTKNPIKQGRWLIEFSESNAQLFEEKLGALNRSLGYN